MAGSLDSGAVIVIPFVCIFEDIEAQVKHYSYLLFAGAVLLYNFDEKLDLATHPQHTKSVMVSSSKLPSEYGQEWIRDLGS